MTRSPPTSVCGCFGWAQTIKHSEGAELTTPRNTVSGREAVIRPNADSIRRLRLAVRFICVAPGRRASIRAMPPQPARPPSGSSARGYPRSAGLQRPRVFYTLGPSSSNARPSAARRKASLRQRTIGYEARTALLRRVPGCVLAWARAALRSALADVVPAHAPIHRNALASPTPGSGPRPDAFFRGRLPS